jgi:hypothetical protein
MMVARSSRRRNLHDVDGGARHRHDFAGARRPVVDPEGDIERQHVEPEETEYRPGPVRQENDAGDAQPTIIAPITSMKPVRPSERCGVRSAWKNGSSGAFVSAMEANYREEMAKSKTKIDAGPAAAKQPAKRRKTARKPRWPSAYSPEEVAEIFRRFEVQRPEPKGELEHSNAFTLLVAVVCRRRRPTPASTRRRAACLPPQTALKKCWRWARRSLLAISAPSDCGATRQRT